MIDTWLLVRNTEAEGERNRLLFVIKSRGMAHSNQVREFILTEHGPELLSVRVGPEGVVTGSARTSLEAGVKAAAARRNDEIEALSRRSEDLNAQIVLMRRQFAEESTARDRLIAQESPNDQPHTLAHTALVETREQGPTAQPAKDGG